MIEINKELLYKILDVMEETTNESIFYKSGLHIGIKAQVEK